MLIRLSVALTTLLSLAAIVVAIPADVDRLSGFVCGSHLTPEAVIKQEAAFASLLAKNGTNEETVAPGAFTIPVIFHITYASLDYFGGYVP